MGGGAGGGPAGMSVRAVTNFVVLPADSSLWKGAVVAAAELCAAVSATFTAAGFAVQTLRIVTNPFGEYLDTTSAETAVAGMLVLKAILDSDAMPQGTRIRFAIGEARSAAELELVPALIAHAADLANCCVNIPSDSLGLPDTALTAAAARCCAALATATAGGEGNFNFTANFNMAPGCPYFPAAYNRADCGANFAVGLECVRSLVAIDYSTPHGSAFFVLLLRSSPPLHSSSSSSTCFPSHFSTCCCCRHGAGTRT
jgi:uncharacterized protein